MAGGAAFGKVNVDLVFRVELRDANVLQDVRAWVKGNITAHNEVGGTGIEEGADEMRFFMRFAIDGDQGVVGHDDFRSSFRWFGDASSNIVRDFTPAHLILRKGVRPDVVHRIERIKIRLEELAETAAFSQLFLESQKVGVNLGQFGLEILDWIAP